MPTSSSSTAATPAPDPAPHEALAWLAVGFALIGFLAASQPAYARSRYAAIKPEDVTAWVTTGCSAFMLVLSTGIAAAHRISAWRSRPPRRRKLKPRIIPTRPEKPPDAS